MSNKLLLKLNNNNKMINLLKQNNYDNSMCFRFILTSYSNLDLLDEMIIFYTIFNHNDIISLGILSSKIGLKTIQKYINFNLLDVNMLKHFYRLSIKYNNESIKNYIWNILISKEKIRENIVTNFNLNNKEYIINLVEKLLKNWIIK